MYRKDLQRKEEEMESTMQEKNFFIQVGNLPIMATALTQLGSIYERTKESNSVIRYTLETAESGAKVVLGTSQPVINQFERPIVGLNKVACNQLDKLKHNYPLITKPADEVLSVTKAYCMGSVRPTLNCVNSATEYSINKYNSVKDYGKEKVEGVRSYTVNQWEGAKHLGHDKVTQVKVISQSMLTQALKTVYGQSVMQTVDGILEQADQYVDYYLPPDVKFADEKTEGEEKELVKLAVGATPLAKLGYVSNKARQRMYTRAMRNIRDLQLRSKATLENLNFTVNLIEYGQKNMSGLSDKMGGMKEKMADVWQQINEEQTEKEAENEEKSAEEKVIGVARVLTHNLKRGIHNMASSASMLPVLVQAKFEQAKNYSEDLYQHFSKAENFNDIPAWLVTHTRETLGYMHETMDWLLQYTLTNSPVAWMVPRKRITEAEQGVVAEEKIETAKSN